MPPAALVRVADFMRSSVMLALSPCALLGLSGGEHPHVKHTQGGTQSSSPHSQKQARSDSPMQCSPMRQGRHRQLAMSLPFLVATVFGGYGDCDDLFVTAFARGGAVALLLVELVDALSDATS
jgi:hypothetical protein